MGLPKTQPLSFTEHVREHEKGDPIGLTAIVTDLSALIRSHVLTLENEPRILRELNEALRVATERQRNAKS